MTLTELGDLGDFLGGIGVIVTLAYLAVQIRRNTQAVRSASLDAVFTSHVEFQRTVWADPVLTKVWFDGMTGTTDLLEEDSRRFLFMLISAARLWENSYYKARGGTLESTSWAGMHQELTGVFAGPGVRIYWKLIRNMFSPDFVAFAEGAVRARTQPK